MLKHRWLSAAAALALGFGIVAVAGAGPPGTSAAWSDVLPAAGATTTTQLGIVNGFPEAVARTAIPPTPSFKAIPGIQGLAGPEPITIFSACTTPGATSPCTSTSPGIRQQAGLDVCGTSTSLCSFVDSSGTTLATGTIDMHWFAVRAAPGASGAHQQVAILEHGTGTLANLHGVLTHPGATDPRCVVAIGCYVGTIHWDPPCISGSWPGPLVVGQGQSVCVSAGATISGPTIVQKDGELFADGATFSGPVSANGAATISLCGDKVSGPVSVTGTTGPVLIGEPATGDCPGNTISGPVSLAGNGCATCDADGLDTGALDFSGNTVSGPLVVTNNVGAFLLGDFAPNTVSGPVVTSGNS